ncbi:hypothetical protein ABEB36_014233 [Hypothenemus hampei]|uniref:NADH dehydrogenase [ubiquinone] 1 beta subcomplex subunit 5, mitochondrial n=1 Tax=Hypothenemus hampei TaxID=57062 RepID=A0ABD1E4P2_HYPHA
MSLVSKLKPLLRIATQNSAKRAMSEHRTFPLQPTRWQWKKFKDLVHYYVMLGAIPCGLFTFYMNVFEGPATLSEIPEGYIPKYWEYYKNPVTRFLAKNFYPDPQQEYEKFCTYIFVEQEKIRLREIEQKVLNHIAERGDYQAYYYKPVAAKYQRMTREGYEKIKDLHDINPQE